MGTPAYSQMVGKRSTWLGGEERAVYKEAKREAKREVKREVKKRAVYGVC